MPDAETAYAFLSYSRMDQAFAAYLARDLRARGIHLWFDQLDIAPGQNWDAAIHQALHGARAVLFVVSAHSVVSENVLNELTVALDPQMGNSAAGRSGAGAVARGALATR